MLLIAPEINFAGLSHFPGPNRYAGSKATCKLVVGPLASLRVVGRRHNSKQMGRSRGPGPIAAYHRRDAETRRKNKAKRNAVAKNQFSELTLSRHVRLC